MSKETKVKIFLPFVFALVMISGMYLGAKMKEESGGKEVMTYKTKKDKLNELLNYIELRYVDTVDHDHLVQSAISGVLKKLDPHSVYIPPKRLKRATQNLKGKFEGIGIEFFIVNDTIMVVSPISGGPSDKLGIQSGDKIIKIDGENVAGTGITNNDVVNTLRGKKGTEVEVAIKRPGMKELIDFTIVRDKIPLYSVDVSYMLNEKTGYIKINRFSSTTYKEFMQAMQQLKEKGLEKLILDLRGNPGGYMSAATRIADEFLPDDKLIVYTEGRAQPKQNYYATERGQFEEGPLTILIDRSSASASEILAGAIQDWGRGKIVGRRSFGKGLVQEQHTFSDSSAIRLTVARYYTPAGRSIQKPYKNGFKAYYREKFLRYKRGELQHPDSVAFIDSLKYTSPTGKVVYGGGGIMPDVFVPIDTSNRSVFMGRVLQKGLIPQFAYSYVANHKSIKTKYNNIHNFKENFEIEPDILQAFNKYAEEHNVVLEGSMDMETKERLKKLLKAYMAKQVWESKGFYHIYHEIDDIFQKAYHIMQESQES